MKRHLLLGFSFAFALNGCRAVGPDYHKPAPPALAGRFPDGKKRSAAIEVQWWKNFHDSTLIHLVETARRANLDLAQAEAHLREARALADSANLGGWGAEIRNSTLQAGWELDLFGKIRRGEEAADAHLDAVAALRDGVLVSVSAEVATAYLQLRGSQQALARAAESVASGIKATELSQTALRLGRATGIDATHAEAQLSEKRATLPLLRLACDSALARLAVLTGQAPGALDAKLGKTAPIPFVPDTVVAGLPTDLLRNRPDVRAAERELAASVAEIGSETADLYPQLSLGGTLGYSVGTPRGVLWNAGPNLSWAALNIPRVRTHIAAAQARADAALAKYQQTVLNADEEATVALSAWKNQRDRRDELRYAVSLARVGSKQARDRLQAGVLTLPALLDAERAQSGVETELAESETQTALCLVSIYQALGGGWQKPAR